MEPDRLKEMQEGIAEAKGVSLFREYTEAEAADFLEMHVRTLAQMRREGRVGFVRKGPRNIRYLGVHVADFVIGSIAPAKERSAPDKCEIAPPQPKEPAERVKALTIAQRTFGRPKEV